MGDLTDDGPGAAAFPDARSRDPGDLDVLLNFVVGEFAGVA
ncbi:hypothetical protein [Actinomadura meridiana]